MSDEEDVVEVMARGMRPKWFEGDGHASRQYQEVARTDIEAALAALEAAGYEVRRKREPGAYDSYTHVKNWPS